MLPVKGKLLEKAANNFTNRFKALGRILDGKPVQGLYFRIIGLVNHTGQRRSAGMRFHITAWIFIKHGNVIGP